MKLIPLIILAFIVTSCGSTTSEQDNNSQDRTEKNQITDSYNTKQVKDSISGKGTKVVPVKLKKGIAIIELTVENNYQELVYSLGEKQLTNIILTIKDSDGNQFPEMINEQSITYNGSISLGVPSDGDYFIEIQTSGLSKWTLKIK